MDFHDFKNKTNNFINEYITEIDNIGKVANLETLKKHTDSLRCKWDVDNDLIRRQMIETLNEICFIHYLSVNYTCLIFYEKVMGPSGRSIDIEFVCDDQILLFDIKTIHPDKIDRWDDFVNKKEKGIIDGHITMYKNHLGGEFWHSMIASRTKFIEYTLEFESKIREHQSKEKTSYIMLFCGNGDDWHIDELEDFVEWYKTDHFVESDHFRTMTKHSINKKQIKFDRSVDNFAVLHRENTVKDYNIIHQVRMDKLFRRYIKE